MATCLQTINAGAVEDLFPNTSTPFSVNILTNKVFRISSSATSQAIFNFVFSPVATVTTVSITVTAFQRVGSAYVDLGSVVFNDLIASFPKDFDVGEYYICIRSNQSYTATVVGTFSGFAPTVTFSPNFYDGNRLQSELTLPRPVTPCDEPMFYEIVEGVLPPGVFMNSLGRLYGELPNLDCLEDSPQFSPSQNWSYPDPDGTMHPWGRQWRFKVRVSIADQSDTFADEWFCVAVHNNWSFDRENFLRNAPFKQVREVVVVEEAEKLPDNMCMVPCETPIESVFVPRAIEKPTCPVCEESDVVTDIQLIKIPDLCQKIDVNALPLWWIENEGKDFASLEVQKFIEHLRNSPYFQGLLAQSGYTKTTIDPDTVIEATAFQNFIQLTASTLVDGRRSDHIDAMMLEWKLKQNQKLPTTAIGYDGTGMILALS